MEKMKRLEWLKAEHEALRAAVQALDEDQMLHEVVADGWTTCDILVHCAIWNLGELAELEHILNNAATWHMLLTSEYIDEFNQVELEKRRGKSVEAVLAEWGESFDALSARIEALTDAEWQHQSGDACWDDGRPMTVFSLFEYEYKGRGHEGGHAEDINEHFQK